MDSNITIGAFSRLCGISVSALRFYDQAGVLQPAAVHGETGYRFYSPEQTVTAERLRDLRRLEFSLDQIRQYEQASKPDQQRLITDQLAMLADRLAQAEVTARSLRSRQEQENVMTPVQLDARALSRAIDQVVVAASEADDLTMITNVLIEAREGSVRLVGTDRYRLALRDLMCHADSPEPFRAVVEPARLRQLQPHLTDTDTALISIEGDVVRVTCGSNQFELPVTGTDYPPYEKLLSVSQEAQVLTALRDDVLGALRRSGHHETVQLVFGGDALTVNSDEPVHATYSGDPLTITLARKFLDDAISNSIGPDLMIEATGPLAPVSFRSADDGSYLCMVMPIRPLELATN